MNLGQLIVLASAYVAGVVLSLRPIGRVAFRDSTIDPHEMAGWVVAVAVFWPVFWIFAGISGAARWHLKKDRRYDKGLVEEARKAYGGTD